MTISIIALYEEILKGKRERFPRGTWNDKRNAAVLVKYLIEEKLQWSREEVCKNLEYTTFKSVKLHGMIHHAFNHSPHEALEAAFPGEYKPWELHCAPQRFWDPETRVEATKWMIEEKLKWSHKEVCQHLSSETFAACKLGSLLGGHFQGIPYRALDAAYPGKYKPWELEQARAPKGFWNMETGIMATKWLVEEKLGWTAEQAQKGIPREVFMLHRLDGMLQTCFKRNPKRAIRAAYVQTI